MRDYLRLHARGSSLDDADGFGGPNRHREESAPPVSIDAARVEDVVTETAPAGEPVRPPAPYSPAEILVQLVPGSAGRGAAPGLGDLPDQVAAQVGGRVVEIVADHRTAEGDGGLLLRIHVGAGLSVEQAIEHLERNPNVAFAEPNFIQTLNVFSNDPSYPTLWGMRGQVVAGGAVRQPGGGDMGSWNHGYD